MYATAYRIISIACRGTQFCVLAVVANRAVMQIVKNKYVDQITFADGHRQVITICGHVRFFFKNTFHKSLKVMAYNNILFKWCCGRYTYGCT